MSVCEVCGGVTAEARRHARWHRTMSNLPEARRALAVPTDVDGRRALVAVDEGAFPVTVWVPVENPPYPEPTPIYDAVLADMEAERRAFPSITLGADTQAYLASMRSITERLLGGQT